MPAVESQGSLEVGQVESKPAMESQEGPAPEKDTAVQGSPEGPNKDDEEFWSSPNVVENVVNGRTLWSTHLASSDLPKWYKEAIDGSHKVTDEDVSALLPSVVLQATIAKLEKLASMVQDFEFGEEGSVKLRVVRSQRKKRRQVAAPDRGYTDGNYERTMATPAELPPHAMAAWPPQAMPMPEMPVSSAAVGVPVSQYGMTGAYQGMQFMMPAMPQYGMDFGGVAGVPYVVPHTTVPNVPNMWPYGMMFANPGMAPMAGPGAAPERQDATLEHDRPSAPQERRPAKWNMQNMHVYIAFLIYWLQQEEKKKGEKRKGQVLKKLEKENKEREKPNEKEKEGAQEKQPTQEENEKEREEGESQKKSPETQEEVIDISGAPHPHPDSVSKQAGLENDESGSVLKKRPSSEHDHAAGDDKPPPAKRIRKDPGNLWIGAGHHLVYSRFVTEEEAMEEAAAAKTNAKNSVVDDAQLGHEKNPDTAAIGLAQSEVANPGAECSANGANAEAESTPDENTVNGEATAALVSPAVAAVNDAPTPSQKTADVVASDSQKIVGAAPLDSSLATEVQEAEKMDDSHG